MNQKLFEALENVCNFTALESDMFEIKEAIVKDELHNNCTTIERLVVSNHAENNYPYGKIVIMDKEYQDFNKIELSFENEGKTLKINIT